MFFLCVFPFSGRNVQQDLFAPTPHPHQLYVVQDILVEREAQYAWLDDSSVAFAFLAYFLVLFDVNVAIINFIRFPFINILWHVTRQMILFIDKILTTCK